LHMKTVIDRNLASDRARRLSGACVARACRGGRRSLPRDKNVQIGIERTSAPPPLCRQSAAGGARGSLRRYKSFDSPEDLSLEALLDFEAIETTPRRQALHLSARVIELRLNAVLAGSKWV